MSPPSTDPRERASRRAHGHQQWEHGCRTEKQVLLMTFDLSTFNSSVQPLGLPVTYYSIKTTFCIKWLLICPPKWHLSVDKKTNIWYIIYFKCIFFWAHLAFILFVFVWFVLDDCTNQWTASLLDGSGSGGGIHTWVHPNFLCINKNWPFMWLFIGLMVHCSDCA